VEATVQLGEAIAIVLEFLGLKEAEPPVFIAGVIEVTVLDGLQVCHRGKTVTTPHWKRDEDMQIADDWRSHAQRLGLPPGPYSMRAAALLIRKKAKLRVKVKVLKSKRISGKATLTGVIGGLTFTGTCPTGEGEHTVEVTADAAPDVMRVYRGRIQWRLEITSPVMSVSAGGSLIELYFVMATPRPMYTKGVWVEVLRLLFGRVGVDRTWPGTRSPITGSSTTPPAVKPSTTTGRRFRSGSTST
jgi:hypothetical protein